MAKQSVSEKPIERGTASAPPPIEEYIESGWTHYSKKEYFRAEADFQKALAIIPNHPDTLYALGMTQQASGKQQDAISTFEKVIGVLQDANDIDYVRVHMLTRLARGHINRMRTGDWGLDMDKQ